MDNWRSWATSEASRLESVDKVGARNVAAKVRSARSGLVGSMWSVANRIVPGLLRHPRRLRGGLSRRFYRHSCDCYVAWDGLNVSRGLASVCSSEPLTMGAAIVLLRCGRRRSWMGMNGSAGKRLPQWQKGKEIEWGKKGCRKMAVRSV